MTSKLTSHETSTGNNFATIAGFVGGENPAFYVQFWPKEAPKAHIVYLPPFGEEMNRCRSLVAEQARQFAREGFSCTILDFYGTGESRGDLISASLPIWRQNIDDALEYLLGRHQCPVYLWGCRLGSLIALDYVSERPETCKKLLLWQPVSSGGTFVTQLLRQRSAAMMQRGEKAESTSAMKQQLAAGSSIDVGGYKLGGALLTAIDQLEVAGMLKDSVLDDSLDINWLEHVDEPDGQLGAKAKRIIGELQARAKVLVKTFTGEPAWQLNERANCNDLLIKTRELGL